MAKSKLQTVYYTAFFLLVIIPVCVIGAGTLGVLRFVMLESAVSNIQLAQKNLSSAISTEVKDASLAVAHLIYVNNNQIVRLAAEASTDDTAARYTYYGALSSAVNFVIKPAKNIVSLTFYTAGGNSPYLKEEIKIPHAEIASSDWYRRAMEHRNTVKIGSYSKPLTYSSASGYTEPFVIVAAISPDILTDPSGKIEVAALFIRSQARALIRDYNHQRSGLGHMYVTDRSGRVLIQQDAPEPEFPPEIFRSLREPAAGIYHFQSGSAHKKAIVSIEPETGWHIVSIVDTGTLLRGFYRAAAVVSSITAALLILFTAFSRYFLRNIIFPVNGIIRGLAQVDSGDFTVRIEPCGLSEIRKMIHSFNHTVSRLKTVNEEKDRERQRKYEAELKALQSQINPHFLVNTLGSIRFMAHVAKFDSLRKMAEALIKILTCSFRSNIGFYTLSEELDVLESYVYLMKIRYSEGFDVIYEVDATCLCCRVPRLILQPLVENAIVHGFEQSDDPSLIIIRVRTESNAVRIDVSDNGCGMNEQQISNLLRMTAAETYADEEAHAGIGIRNVHSRLILNFGPAYGLKIRSTAGTGTTVTVRIPHV